VSFLKGPNTIYSVGLVLGYQYIVRTKKSMGNAKSAILSYFKIAIKQLFKGDFKEREEILRGNENNSLIWIFRLVM
jgi:predicted transposase YbfD/YdcC